ncbi:MAG: endonuclease/exonuclease/phosphatase family protein [Spirochaetales bacterium]|nr:endonuclease/exonuclease/phosphatase family protein [Spirochaetales bacterium]
MKRLVFLFLLVGASVFAGEFSVISYNVWNGLDYGKGETQRANLVQMMQEEAPDVVAYQELCGFNSISLRKLSEDIGHKYSVILKISGYPVGISSKYPISDVKKMRTGFWHGALSCRINNINFVVVHFSPAYADFRLKESNMILDFLRKTGKIDDKTIILGDFNAVSDVNREFLSQQGIEEDDNANDFSVMNNFFANGLFDTAVLGNNNSNGVYTFPANLLVAEESSFGQRVRIDYQLISKALLDNVVSYQVLINDFTRNISDHYPVKVLYNF